MQHGDQIVSVDGVDVIGSSHRRVVELMSQASIAGRVALGVRRQLLQEHKTSFNDDYYPYDVTVTRRHDEGFGFVIISSVAKAGSTIGKRNI